MPMPVPAPASSSEGVAEGPSRRPLVLAGVTVGALILAGALLALPSGEIPVADTTEPPETTTAPPSTRATTTQAPTTTTLSTTTIETTTTTEARSDPVDEARADLEEALSMAHPSDLSPPQVRDLLDKADEAIELAGDGKDREAGRKLREVAREVDDKLDGEVRHESLESLVRLADALDISLEPDRDRDDDDDDDDD